MYKYIAGIMLYCFLMPLAAQNNMIDVIAGKTLAQKHCANCHGLDGNKTILNAPALASLQNNTIIKALIDYQTTQRPNAIMTPIAIALSDNDIVNLADFYSRQSRMPNSADPMRAKEGSILYRAGNFDKKIPACSGCHNPTGTGNPSAVIPRLSFQSEKYIVQQLKLFQTGIRTSDTSSAMQRIAQKMTIDEMEAVATFCAGLH